MINSITTKLVFTAGAMLLVAVLISSCSTMESAWAPSNFAKIDLDDPTNRFSATYDRFDDMTKYESTETRVYPSQELLNRMKVYDEVDEPLNYLPHQIYVEFLAGCEGNNRCVPDKIAMFFTSYSTEGWKLLDYNKVVILYDDNRFEFNEPDMSHEAIFGNSVLSVAIVEMSRKEFELISESKLVEGKIGLYQIGFDSPTKNAMKEFLLKTSKN